jgi:3-oxoadipate enol-lactonase
LKTLQRDGATVGWDVVGEGPALLLCHGLLGDGRLWDGVAPALSERFRLIVPDLRGHRSSLATRPFTLWEVAEDLRAILDAEGVSSALVAGFSMGGMAALRLTLAAPDRVRALALLNSAASREPWFPRVRNLGMAAVVNLAGPLRAFEPIASGLMFSKRFRAERPEVVEQAFAAYRGHGGASLAHAIRAVFNRDDLAARLEEVRLPARVVAGELDPQTPPAWSAQLALGIRGATLVTLPGAGHMTPLEQPEAVAQQLREFFSPMA